MQILKKKFADMLTSEQCYDYVKSMALSKEVVDRNEKTTREQADSKLWHALHNGRLTSSRFGDVCCVLCSTTCSYYVCCMLTVCTW